MDSREAVNALRSCTLVCRAWAPAARRHLQQAAFSGIWSLVVRHLDSIDKDLDPSMLPAAYPILQAARSMLHNPRPKAPVGTYFSSITHLTLGSQNPDRVAIICVDALCRAIASLEPLRQLKLMYCTWGDSGSYHSQPPVHSSHSHTRLRRIDVQAERDWLLDIRSVHFITWLVRSGTASELMYVHFERMMILEKRLLAAVAAIVRASKGSLRQLCLDVGPDLDMQLREFSCSLNRGVPVLNHNHAVVRPLSQCYFIPHLSIKLPYQIVAFRHLTSFLAALRFRGAGTLDLQFRTYPSCVEPPAGKWKQLDQILQTCMYRRHLNKVTVMEMDLTTSPREFIWGDRTYPGHRYDPVACRRKMAELLPLTHGRRLLHYRNSPYNYTPERVPDRVRPFLPVEIAERIMDFVAGMKTGSVNLIWPQGVPATLAACSLTCRDWRPRAQAHLFRVVTLSSVQRQRCNISGFLSLLAIHPALGPFVRTCTVRDIPSPPAKSPSLHTTPFQLLRMLPQIEHLRLRAGTFYPPPGVAFDACMRRSSSIVKLWIDRVAFYSVNDLRRMINACRSLKNLQLNHCMWHGKPKAAVTGLGLLTSVRLAEVRVFGEAEWIMDPRSANFLQWLVHSGALVSAREVRFPRLVAGAGDILAASRSVIHACCDTLAVLYLLLTPGVDYDCCEFAFNWDLSSRR